MRAITQDGLHLHDEGGRVQRIVLRADTAMSAIAQADCVLICVKSSDTAGVAQAMAPWLREDAVAVSLQNGVENPALLARLLDRPVIAALAYLAAALPEPGVVQHAGGRDMVIGAVDPLAAHGALDGPLQSVAALFASAGLQVRITGDAMAELWNKLIVNCACNAISALAQADYALMAALPAVRELQRGVVREGTAVAKADGRNVSLQALLAAVDQVAVGMPRQRSSTAQDLARGRASEIDHLNGYLQRRGAELGIATPLNQALWALVKLVEAGRG